MQFFSILLAPVFVTILLSACAPGSYLASINDDCKKYMTPDAQMACEKKYKESAQAFEEYQAKKKAAEKGDDASHSKDADLCYKSASGEMKCPN